jgi:prepilin-type N-terminal cleavage/methylation domain-containing protein
MAYEQRQMVNEAAADREAKAPRWGGRGFTITELMVAVLILAILAVVGISSTARQADSRAVRAASALVIELVQESRARSLSSSRAVILEFVAGGTAAESSIRWFESTNNLCNGVLPTADPAGEVILDPAAGTGRTRNVALMRVAPAAADTIRLCFQPTGRVVNAATSRPFFPLSLDGLGGRAYIELNPLTCTRGTCTVTPYTVTVAVGFNGLAEVMAPEFRLP